MPSSSTHTVNVQAKIDPVVFAQASSDITEQAVALAKAASRERQGYVAESDALASLHLAQAASTLASAAAVLQHMAEEH